MTWYGPAAPGRRPKYLDRPMTPAERAQLYRARKKGVAVPVADPLAPARAALAAYDNLDTIYHDVREAAACECIKQLRFLLEKY